jgi:hypothetical protein
MINVHIKFVRIFRFNYLSSQLNTETASNLKRITLIFFRIYFVVYISIHSIEEDIFLANSRQEILKYESSRNSSLNSKCYLSGHLKGGGDIGSSKVE